MSVIDVSELEQKLGKSFTDLDRTLITRKLDAMRDELEEYCHATLERRERTDTIEATGIGAVHLLGPIIQVLQVIEVATGTEVEFSSGNDPVRPDAIFPYGARIGKMYEVTYEAGSSTSSAVLDIMWDAIVSQQIVGVEVASGAYSSINVEGASFGLGGRFTGNNPSQRGSFSPSDLTKVRHLRRMVVA